MWLDPCLGWNIRRILNSFSFLVVWRSGCFPFWLKQASKLRCGRVRTACNMHSEMNIMTTDDLLRPWTLVFVMQWLDVTFWSSPKQEIESWLDDEEHLFWKQPQSVQTSLESWYRWLWNISNILNWCWKRILNLDFRETMKINIKHHQTSSNLDLIIPDLKFSFWFWDVLGFRHRENLGEVPEVTVLTPSSPQLLLTEGAYMVLYMVYIWYMV